MNTSSPGQRNQLKPNAIGLVGVVFMVVAFSAPITAMTGNLPVAVGFGNGSGAPAGFIIATIVLTIFSIGFVAMAKHITAAGAFYTFVSHGLGKPVGLSAGVMSMVTYMTMEAGLVGIFAAFCQGTFAAQFGLDIHWIFFAIFALVAIGMLSYRDISLAAKVLGLVLIGEIALLSIMAFGVLFHGGGPDGLMLSSINPLSGFETNGVKDGVVGLGLLFAFWSWVGFESTAIYGEESKDPKRIVPRATMIAVIGIGVFYTFISWMTVAGSGEKRAIELASGSNPFELLYSPMREYVGSWGVVGFEWFVLGGSFACALAIHNSATRYLYAFGRDGLLWRPLGSAHPQHQSPHVASVVQSVFAAVVIAVCWVTRVDPYATLFVLVAIMATVSLLLVQTMCSLATISYFHVRKQHPETASWWRTFLAPVIGGLGMLYVCYLLVTNMASAAGAASETLFFKMIPWLVLLMFFGSVAVALHFRRSRPDVYARIGSTVFSEPAAGAAPHGASGPRAAGSGSLLVGYDGSRPARAAVEWAARLAARDGRSLHLVQVSRDGHDAQGALAEAASFVRLAEPGVQVGTEVVEGSPASVLVEASRHSDLVVIGTRGHGDVAGAFLGSVAFSVSAHAACPVVVVRGDGTVTPGPGRPVVVGVDGSPAAEAALRFAATHASLSGAPLVVVSAFHADTPQLVGSAYRSTVAPGRGLAADEQAQAEGVASRAVELVSVLHPEVEVRSEVPAGSAGRVLGELAEGAGLVVVGARGRGGFAGLLLGSVSHDIIHRASVPVAVLRH